MSSFNGIDVNLGDLVTGVTCQSESFTGGVARVSEETIFLVGLFPNSDGLIPSIIREFSAEEISWCEVKDFVANAIPRESQNQKLYPGCYVSERFVGSRAVGGSYLCIGRVTAAYNGMVFVQMSGIDHWCGGDFKNVNVVSRKKVLDSLFQIEGPIVPCTNNFPIAGKDVGKVFVMSPDAKGEIITKKHLYAGYYLSKVAAWQTIDGTNVNIK